MLSVMSTKQSFFEAFFSFLEQGLSICAYVNYIIRIKVKYEIRVYLPPAQFIVYKLLNCTT